MNSKQYLYLLLKNNSKHGFAVAERNLGEYFLSQTKSILRGTAFGSLVSYPLTENPETILLSSAAFLATDPFQSTIRSINLHAMKRERPVEYRHSKIYYKNTII